MRLFIDIETRSPANLKQTGQYVYAEDERTEIIVVCYALDDDPVETWFPVRGEPMPDVLALALADPKVQLVAHNASFERILLNARPGRLLGFPALPLERWDCTAARAAAMCLPRTLEGAAAAAGLPAEKDKEGHALMLRMCKPRKPRKGEPADRLLWQETPEQIDRLGAYCRQDVEVERALSRVLPPLSVTEREVWRLTEVMNDRGVAVDAALLLRICFLIDDAERDVNARIRQATCGREGGCNAGEECWRQCGGVPAVSNHAALTQWLVRRGIDDADETGVGKAAIRAMLESTDLDPLVRSVLFIRQQGGGTASKKYHAILARLSADGRLRGALVYCGAAATGRWSSRGAQMQNMLRQGKLHVEHAIRDIMDGATIEEIAEIHGPPLMVAGELLRPTFIGRPALARGDSSQIEARVNPWLAGADWKLEAFRRYDTILGWEERKGKRVPVRAGPDLYRVAAGSTFGKSPDAVTDPERQTGKVQELALGYQGGPGALQAMARAYGIKFPHWDRPRGVLPSDAPAPPGTDQWVVDRWRETNPEIKALWRELETAAADCVEAPPGREHFAAAGRIRFKRNSQAMAMRLPSGRPLIYWNPKLKRVMTPWGEWKWAVVYRAEDSVTHRWMEFAAYGGLYDENADQGTARDLMAYWLLEFERAGLRPVLTVHDEGINETGADAEVIEAIMRRVPPWGAGLPVAADASAGLRYVKS